MPDACATPETLTTSTPTTGPTGLFRALVRRDLPESPEAFVLMGTTAFLGGGFLVMALSAAHRIWIRGDLGAGAMSAITATAASLALLIAYVKGRRPDVGGVQ